MALLSYLKQTCDWEIPKGKSESVNRRTENTMVIIKSTKEQTTIKKTLDRKGRKDNSVAKIKRTK
jgi:hypothetical protein